jgi:hypothetical protein
MASFYNEKKPLPLGEGRVRAIRELINEWGKGQVLVLWGFQT